MNDPITQHLNKTEILYINEKAFCYFFACYSMRPRYSSINPTSISMYHNNHSDDIRKTQCVMFVTCCLMNKEGTVIKAEVGTNNKIKIREMVHK